MIKLPDVIRQFFYRANQWGFLKLALKLVKRRRQYAVPDDSTFNWKLKFLERLKFQKDKIVL